MDDFLAFGRNLWSIFSFYEGELSPEEEGSLLYGLKERGTGQLRKILPANNYARFLSPDAVRLAKIQDWAVKDHPLASIQSLPDGGSLVVWDASREGLARFLSDEFSAGVRGVSLYANSKVPKTRRPSTSSRSRCSWRTELVDPDISTP